MKNRAPVRRTLALCVVAVISTLFFSHLPAYAAAAVPEPPALTWKEITANTNIPGTVQQLEDKIVKYTLFVPNTWSAPANGDVNLAIHFHGAYWFGIQEHLARGLRGPLVNFDLGQGSEVYRRAFENEQHFAKFLKGIEKELAKRAGRDVRISNVEISSFSAGYAAVRELVKVPEYFELISRITLLDSLYARFNSAGERGRKVTEPAFDHIEPWIPFAQAAVRGQKTFLITYSQVPTPSYASSGQTAEALMRAVGVPSQPLAANSSPAASEPDYPLLRRADFGRFHVWGYGGKDQRAHLVHARHLGDFWQALDRAR
jgi:hypothetical protein